MLHKTEQQIEREISDPKASLGNAELYVFSQYKPPPGVADVCLSLSKSESQTASFAADQTVTSIQPRGSRAGGKL